MSDIEQRFRKYAENLVNGWVEKQGFTHMVSGPKTLMAMSDKDADEFRADKGLEVYPIRGNEERTIASVISFERKWHPNAPPRNAFD